MAKITGLDNLKKELKKAEKVFKELDGHLAQVEFDPHDPSSIEAAIQSVHQMIDSRIAPHGNSSIIRPLAEQMKEKCREIILNKASEARLKHDEDE